MIVSMRITKADLGDLETRATVVRLVDAYSQDPMGQGRPLEDAVRTRLGAELSAHPACHVFLAEVDTKAAGVAVCFEGLSTFRALRLLNVHDLAVLPEFRGSGIGRGLLDHVMGWARAQGMCRVSLEVRPDNSRAQALYRSLGFSGGEFENGESMMFWDAEL